MEILGLEYSEPADNSDEEKCEETWLWHSEYEIWSCFRESLLEHLECSEEYDEESNPLDGWIFFEHFCDPAWGDDHEDDRDDESDHEIDHISMTGTCYGEDVIQWHSDISDDDRLDRRAKCTRTRSMLFMMLARTYLTIELPYDIEEEDGTEELESRYLEEKYDPQWEYDTEYCSTGDSPEYGFSPEFWWEFLCRHTDEDGIVTTHDEVYEDDIEQCKSSCRSEEVKKISLKSHEEIHDNRKLGCFCYNLIREKCNIFDRKGNYVVE